MNFGGGSSPTRLQPTALSRWGEGRCICKIGLLMLCPRPQRCVLGLWQGCALTCHLLFAVCNRSQQSAGGHFTGGSRKGVPAPCAPHQR